MNLPVQNFTSFPVGEIQLRRNGQHLNADELSGKTLCLSPGWMDVQVNGFGGINLTVDDLQPEQVAAVSQMLLEEGVTRWCPTIISSSASTTTHAIRAIRAACQASSRVQASVAGIHLEGPYISPQDGFRGAHASENVRTPDWQEFSAWQAEAGDLIRIITLAPEVEGCIPFIEQAAQNGVIVAIGHSAATAGQVRQAIAAGARLATHLGNGIAANIHRHNNPIWPLLADARVFAGVIFDGFHLPADVMQVFFEVKGADRLLLTSDTTQFGRMPPGVYETTIGGKVELHANGKLTMYGSNEYLAGSSSSLRDCFETSVRLLGLTLEEAVRMAAQTPRALLGLEEDCSEILFLWDPEHARAEILAAFENGDAVWTKPGNEIHFVRG